MATANEQILDRTIRHQIGLYRVATRTTSDVGALLNQGDARIVQLLETINEDTNAREVEGALRAIKKLNEQSYAVVLAGLLAAMVLVARYEMEFQSMMLSEVLGQVVIQQLPFTVPTASELTSVVEKHSFDGARLSEYVAGIETGRYNRIRDAIRREYSKAEVGATRSILAAVVGTPAIGYGDGIFGLGLRSLEQVIRTVQNGVVSATRDLLYDDNAYMFSGVLWASVLDTKTSDICQHLDGKVFPIGQGQRPPAHRQCRSTTVPIVRNWQDLKLSDLSDEAKAELDGQPPERITYAQWLSRQPAAIQDEVLGPTRGRMYRKGEASFDRFVDKKGHRYTLDQLRKREGLQ